MESKSGTDNIINVEDNFLTVDEHESVLYYCLGSKYGYGEWDRPELPPTGMVADIEEHEDIYKFFKEKTEPFVPTVRIRPNVYQRICSIRKSIFSH